jgi:hypothetical protein
MIFDKLFPTENEKNEAINRLTSLISNSDWQFLSGHIMKSEIDEITDILLGTKFDNLEVENEMKLKRDLMIILSQFPDKIVEALKSGDNTIPEFDPYPKTIEDLKKRGKSE